MNYLSVLKSALFVVLALSFSLAAQETKISGYSYGSAQLNQAPYTIDDLKKLQLSVLWSEEDEQYLRKSGEVLEDQIDDILDVWYGFVAGHPHLLYYFSNKNKEADSEYLAKVRRRFGQWIKDTYQANYDQNWLNYQYEIGLRHHRLKKNRTDNVDAVDHIHFRYLPAFIFPITYTLKPFLAKGNHSAEETEKMYVAWQKSVILQVILWSYPYIKEGDF